QPRKPQRHGEHREHREHREQAGILYVPCASVALTLLRSAAVVVEEDVGHEAVALLVPVDVPGDEVPLENPLAGSPVDEAGEVVDEVDVAGRGPALPIAGLPRPDVAADDLVGPRV